MYLFLLPTIDGAGGGGALPAGALIDINAIGIVDVNAVQIVSA